MLIAIRTMATIPSTAAARTFRLACCSAATGGAGGAISSDSRISGCSKSGPFFGYGWPFVCGRWAGGKRLSTATTVTGSGAGTGGGEGGGTTTLGARASMVVAGPRQPLAVRVSVESEVARASAVRFRFGLGGCFRNGKRLPAPLAHKRQPGERFGSS